MGIVLHSCGLVSFHFHPLPMPYVCPTPMGCSISCCVDAVVSQVILPPGPVIASVGYCCLRCSQLCSTCLSCCWLQCPYVVIPSLAPMGEISQSIWGHSWCPSGCCLTCLPLRRHVAHAWITCFFVAEGPTPNQTVYGEFFVHSSLL